MSAEIFKLSGLAFRLTPQICGLLIVFKDQMTRAKFVVARCIFCNNCTPILKLIFFHIENYFKLSQNVLMMWEKPMLYI